jgi:type VI secretion system protein VasD
MSKHIHLSRLFAVAACSLASTAITGCAAVSAIGAVAGLTGNAMEMAKTRPWK